MQPSGSWTELMAWAVRAAWTALRAPVLTCSARTVHHQALAHDGVERTLEEPDRSGPADDVPDQAAQPPVGDVQSVRMVGARDAHTGSSQPIAQLATSIDAHVPPRPVVVGPGQGPAHALREPARHADRQRPARSEHTGDLGDRGFVLHDVLQ